MSRARVGAVLTVLVCLVSGCIGGGDDSEPSAAEEPTIAPLAVAWTADLGLNDSLRAAAAVDDVVVLVSSQRIVGVDAVSGAEAWTLPARGVCAASQPTEAGLIAVSSTGRGPNAPCRRLGVLDAARGEWLWAKRMTRPMEDPTLSARTPLAVGDSTVTVITTCCYSEALRFDLETGRPLETLDPDLTGWGAWAITDGQVIALSSGLDARSRVRLSLYDADTGRRQWQRTVVELVEENVAGAILSSDPLVLSTSVRGHVLVREVDRRTGRPGTPLGPQDIDHSPDPLQSYGVHDGAVVVSRGIQTPLDTGAARLAAYDLATGEERWSGFPAAGGFAGFDSSDAMIVVSSAGLLADRAAVTRHSMSDVDDLEVLGSVEGSSYFDVHVVGDLLLIEETDGLSAYALPAPGEGQELEVSLPDQSWTEAFLQPDAVDEGRWQDSDVRPGAIDSCHPSTSTLRALGFHRLDLPAQYGCRWFERQEPLGVVRGLEISHQIFAPLQDKQASAEQQAHRSIRKASRSTPPDSGPVAPGAFVAVQGIGDEAYVSSLVGPPGYAETHLLVRVGNVVVRVEARGEATATDVAGATVAGYVLEDGALAAAEDVLARAGLSLGTLPDRGPDGRFSRLDRGCGPLDAASRSYVTGGSRLDQRAEVDPDQRTGGCYWGQGNDYYTRVDGRQQFHEYAKVAAYAVPGSSITGRSGVAQARSALSTLRASDSYFYEDPRRVPDLGDEALLFPARYDSSQAIVVVRLDNLLLEVTVNDQADPDRSARESAAVDLARQALALYA